MVKNRDDNARGFAVFHTSLGATKNLALESASTPGTQSGRWNDTEPTASIFTIGSSIATNGNNDGMIAYCWTSVAGYSSFGSYEGNTSTLPFVNLGFRPALVVCKNVDFSESWQVYDEERGAINVIDESLVWNDTLAEATGTAKIDFLSNGFVVRRTGGNPPNVNGDTYVYFAWAAHPFKTARAR
jgi:hypothetical protein